MFREGGIKAIAARASARVSSLPLLASIPAFIPAARIVVPLLLAEAAAFALAAGSSKIPAFLFTAVRALLTF
ncbi:MAG: hypothetical protein ABI584_12510 [Acidobacteriota bacterium]